MKRTLFALGLLLASTAAQAQVPDGDYISQFGRGSMTVTKGGFEISRVGANGHTCGLSGEFKNGVGVVDEGPDACRIAFKKKGDGYDVTPLTVQNCRTYCGARASFDGLYQPLHEAETGAIVSFEALARWNSPDLGEVGPGEFVAVAERSDIIYPLSRILLRKALKAASQWPEGVQLSFNLSARDLMSPAALTQIIAIAASGPIAPSRIDFEITETALITDFERARKAILALKSIGASVSLDDFGTGYSSLNYVHRLPLDRIKIDRSFVREMETSPLARDVVKTMISMARNLNFDCVIEGVETQEQLSLLKSFGCNMAQGYLFSRPLAENEILPFIDARESLGMPAARKIA